MNVQDLADQLIFRLGKGPFSSFYPSFEGLQIILFLVYNVVYNVAGGRVL